MPMLFKMFHFFLVDCFVFFVCFCCSQAKVSLKKTGIVKKLEEIKLLTGLSHGNILIRARSIVMYGIY